MLKPRIQNYSAILKYLRCPTCGETNLKEVADPAPLKKIKGMKIINTAICCVNCNSSYPITSEGIPLMWTTSLRNSYVDESDVELANSSAALAANVDVYNEISDHYIEYIRQDNQSQSRICSAINSIDANIFSANQIHVDFGCGPGNILIWTEDWALEHNLTRIGIDVSISNLRNVMNRTNAFVILGDATSMPIRDGTALIVTEGSVLHHIKDWRAVVTEACRISCKDSVILFDNEPSKESLDWSRIARTVFEARFYAYYLLSFISNRRRNFRNIKLAKRNYYEAEVHNQPGLGFDSKEIEDAFSSSGFKAAIFRRAGESLTTGSGKNSLQTNILLALSGKDWRNPRYGVLTIMAKRHQ
jgi:ubiquinone/menaquinone biosynthesis C-methylase UbiE/uncharacterized protein YbaR (Trm112 family)